MIVELIGHAGAGKTILAEELRLCLLDKGVETFVINGNDLRGRNSLETGYLQVYSLLRFPSITLLGLALLTRRGLRNWRIVGILAHRYSVIRTATTDKRIVLLDDGVLHAIWSLTLMIKPIRCARLASLRSRVSLADAVISLRPNRTTVLSRLQCKQKHRLQSVTSREINDILNKQESVLDMLENAVREDRSVLRVMDNDPTTILEIGDRLSKIWFEGKS